MKCAKAEVVIWPLRDRFAYRRSLLFCHSVDWGIIVLFSHDVHLRGRPFSYLLALALP